MPPEFLTVDEVIEIHCDQISRYGGLQGIRDRGLLESAVAMPSAAFEGGFLHSCQFDMAAALLFHITKNHPFLDGNKRVGTVAAIGFLMLNDVEIVATQDDLVNLVIAVAEGHSGKKRLRSFFAITASPATPVELLNFWRIAHRSDHFNPDYS